MSERPNLNAVAGLERSGLLLWDDSLGSEVQSKGQSSRRNYHWYRLLVDMADLNHRGQQEVPLPMRQLYVSEVCR